MNEADSLSRSRLKREIVLFAALLGAGLLLLPIAIYFVGRAIFGGYADGDYFDFAGNLYRGLLHGEPTILFLLLSPYLVWQALRLTVVAFRSYRP